MTITLWRFFRKKMRKRNGVWWALCYTWHHYRWLRIERDPVKYQEWLDN